jgi:hypothetical protein
MYSIYINIYMYDIYKYIYISMAKCFCSTPSASEPRSGVQVGQATLVGLNGPLRRIAVAGENHVFVLLGRQARPGEAQGSTMDQPKPWVVQCVV